MSSYDRLDWHVDSAVEAGQPPENAFTHIGLYLAWLVRRDLHNPDVFPPAHVAGVKSGELTGSDIADDIDTKLVSAVMGAEGRAFSDARYSTYLGAYGSEFGDEPAYGVADTGETYARIEPILDRMYAEWVAAGRPQSGSDTNDVAPETAALPAREPSMSIEEIQRISDEVAAELGGVAVMPRYHAPHEAPDLEALIPIDLTDPPMDIASVSASDWGSSLVSRAVKRLGGHPRDAVVVSAMGGRGDQTLVVTIYRVPGAEPTRVETEFEPAIAHPTRTGTWDSRKIHGRSVRWASGPDFTVAFWARGDLVFHVAGEPKPVEAAIARLS